MARVRARSGERPARIGGKPRRRSANGKRHCAELLPSVSVTARSRQSRPSQLMSVLPDQSFADRHVLAANAQRLQLRLLRNAQAHRVRFRRTAQHKRHDATGALHPIARDTCARQRQSAARRPAQHSRCPDPKPAYASESKRETAGVLQRRGNGFGCGRLPRGFGDPARRMLAALEIDEIQPLRRSLAVGRQQSGDAGCDQRDRRSQRHAVSSQIRRGIGCAASSGTSVNNPNAAGTVNSGCSLQPHQRFAARHQLPSRSPAPASALINNAACPIGASQPPRSRASQAAARPRRSTEKESTG